MIDQRTRVAFALWNQSNPPALRAQCTLEKLGVATTTFDDGTTIERDLGLDWDLNRDSYLELADAALAALALPLERAQALNKATFNLALEREGLAKCPLDQLTLLRGASLLELTQAGPIVRAHDQAKAPTAPAQSAWCATTASSLRSIRSCITRCRPPVARTTRTTSFSPSPTPRTPIS
jgi:hypothetical protein